MEYPVVETIAAFALGVLPNAILYLWLFVVIERQRRRDPWV
jgi:hypothetical protein